MKTSFLTVLSLFISTSSLCAITEDQMAADVLSLTNTIGGVFMLAHDEDVDAALKGMLNKSGRTADDLSLALVLAAQGLSNGARSSDAKMRLGVISYLGNYGTTNSIPHLENIMRGGDMDSALVATWSFLDCFRRGIASLDSLTRVLKLDRKEDVVFHRQVYDTLLIHLEFGEMSPEGKKNVRDFLVEASTFDVAGASFLDAVACRAFPDFAHSPERLAMARRLAAEEAKSGAADGPFTSLATTLEAEIRPAQ